MTKVLVAGGSGFIGAHILEQLLAKGHSVVTTVRSKEKAQKILDAHKAEADRLEVAIVPEIAREDAFDEVVKTPGIEVVIHPASPCHLNFTDPQKELIDPAVLGTTNILRAIKRDAPQVRRVIITSSVAAIFNTKDPVSTLTEQSWNPNDLSNIHDSRAVAYCVSKTLAERAAWDYVDQEKPNFDLVTVNPPLVLGPVVGHFSNVDSINASNECLANLVRGKWRDEIPPTGPVNIWIDVRDVAAAHVRAMERQEAGGKRLFTVGGRFSYTKIAEIVREHGPDRFKDKMPRAEARSGDANYTGPVLKFDNGETNRILGIEWTPLEKSVLDFVESIKEFDL
ncbi:putative NADPH-dependent methylglyoxal reductase-like protein [Hapsidospora chrysogenum ATCC 11550]|uniref:Putative NADPH-dependent methylglyoxal reductase-like protein n=1 Tax=Hapsidospora chrysogenum (strain ATCC 11550 / CBS 779.69 / DSM 880 / IAM 14645 / JCM 23072 / IMI 49137) TaxID=857340 RepID=A0A086STY1_HAPC1|nr:putative NADPH-dependent methylglyoxal reductase-like protein [Hapsidospora chrysogenum ATCC 11550]